MPIGNNYLSIITQKLHSATFKKVITPRLGGNAYQQEKLPLLLVTCLNNAKEIKATTHKLALMKGTYYYRPLDL